MNKKITYKKIKNTISLVKVDKQWKVDTISVNIDAKMPYNWIYGLNGKVVVYE